VGGINHRPTLTYTLQLNRGNSDKPRIRHKEKVRGPIGAEEKYSVRGALFAGRGKSAERKWELGRKVDYW